jgi:dienelactone hydrolase
MAWQPNFSLTLGTGGISSNNSQNVDTLIVTGRAAGGSYFYAWYYLTYSRPFAASLSVAGTPYEGSDITASVSINDPTMVSPIAYDWQLDGEAILDPLYDFIDPAAL